MAAKKRSGRAAAEAAYADLIRDKTALVGEVGAAFEAYTANLEAAITGRERYEQARLVAIKQGAVTNEQLDQLGYKKTPKLPSLPGGPETPSRGRKDTAKDDADSAADEDTGVELQQPEAGQFVAEQFAGSSALAGVGGGHDGGQRT